MVKLVYDEKGEFILNSRGMRLYTHSWIPRDEPVAALIFICHGYAMECSISMKGTAGRLATAGYAVYGIDYEGHGRSSGLPGYVPSFDNVVRDCAAHFTAVCGREENRGKQRFLLGESMGGAVSLLLHRDMPAFWDGAVLVAPMCKISDEMKPPAILVRLLAGASRMFPTWKVVPTKNLLDAAVKTPERRAEVRANPLCYKGRPRLKTAQELLAASVDVEKSLHRVSLPFIVVHGGDDVVTDPSASKLLYESAASGDKTLKLYPGMWHALTSGEPPESIDLVFSDIVAWLAARTAGRNCQLIEMASKCNHDVQAAAEIRDGM